MRYKAVSKWQSKTNSKLITPTNHNRSTMKELEFSVITCSLPKRRKHSRVQVAIGFAMKIASNRDDKKQWYT